MVSPFLPYSLGMSLLPFPADSAEFEEYTSVMNAMADEAEASTPDPEPEDFGGRCEDAPCCGCCGNEAYESAMEYERQREDTEYWSQVYERGDDGGEDSHLDSMYEDVNEYGMDGCCGDFWTLTTHPKGWVPF